MNANYGLFAPLAGRARGREKNEAMAARADAEWAAWASRCGLELTGVALAHSAPSEDEPAAAAPGLSL